MEFYISNKTQHGWAPGTSFYHGAYNEYVGSRLAQLDEKYQLSLMLETKTLPEIREQLRLSGQLEMLQADITGLNNELRRANQEGIDLYLRFLYKGIIIKHNKTEPTYTKTSLFLCEKRRFFMARTEKGVVTTI